MVRLKRLKIIHHPLIAPNTELHFADGVNLIVGKNGSGKTTLLTLIDQVLRSDFERLSRLGAQLEYDLQTPTHSVVVGLRAGETDDKGHPLPSVSYQVQFSQDGYGAGQLTTSVQAATDTLLQLTGSLNFAETVETSLLRRVEPWAPATTLRYTQRPEPHNQWRYLDNLLGEVARQLASDGQQALRLTSTSPQDALLPLRFDEALRWWTSWRDAAWVRLYAHPDSDEIRLTAEIPAGETVQATFTPGDPGVVRTVPLIWSDFFPQEVGWREGEPVLRIPDSKGVREVADVLGAQSVELFLEQSGEATPVFPQEDSPLAFEYVDPRFYVRNLDGQGYWHGALSFGQQRMFSFVAYLHTWPHGPVLADELTNGMHHEWLERCVEMIGERQAFLATQNPLLLDYFGYESKEEAQSAFVLCSRDKFGGREKMVWRHMTDEEAQHFYEDHRIGFQHVSEILRAWRLW